jgi:hypothetical protein
MYYQSNHLILYFSLGFLQCVQTRMYHCPDTVRHFKSLWLQLSDLTQEFGNALGFGRACDLVVFFVQEVLAVYGLTSNMEHGFDSVNSIFAVNVVISTYAIFVICDRGQLVTDQVAPQLIFFLNFFTKLAVAYLGRCCYT